MVCFLQDGFTPLSWAASRGHVEVASLLLDRGADPEARDKVSMSRGREVGQAIGQCLVRSLGFLSA